MPLKLPRDHTLRIDLNDEVHARPSEALHAPQCMLYIALLSPVADHATLQRPLVELCARYGVERPRPGSNHFAANFGPFRLRWERHTEFTRYQISFACDPAAPFEVPAGTFPSDWLQSLPGDVIVAARVAYLEAGAVPTLAELSGRWFADNPLVGANVADGAGVAYTDFRIREDGYSRVLVANSGMTPLQAGRIVQRLLEIDTYRMMALMALPVARALGPFLNERDRELAEVTAAMAQPGTKSDPAMLDRLMRLEAEIEGRFADTDYRFSASAAYYALVQARIEELQERRIPGLQTFQEFTERRLAPAMSTCRAVARRVDALSERVSRSTQLLATRVAVTRERQNQMQLETMARRAKLQLRLQQTVEGLSVAAITYYIVGLIGYGAKAIKAAGLHIESDIVTGLSIPVVIALVTIGVEGIRRRLRPD